jgi:YHS domain-containing protein
MKRAILIFSLVAFFAAFASISAQDKQTKQKAAKENVKTSKPKQIWNAYCPIMGEEVDAAVQTVDYKGKTIGFCCKKCIKKFNAAPEKYLKNLSGDGKKFTKQ